MLIAILLALIPAVLILWPFVAGLNRDEFEHDEGAPQADLMRRWDAAVASLASAELDRGLGNMSEDDYQGVRGQLMLEAAAVMRDMELGEDEEGRMLSALGEEIRAVRARVKGESATSTAAESSDAVVSRQTRAGDPDP